MTLSAKHNFQFFLKIFSVLSKEWVFKISTESGYSSFEVIALDSLASKKIDLYSNHTENKF